MFLYSFLGFSVQRKIIHIDADCFYAAVEMRDDPSLRDVPIAIGGSADSRGVISTANYVARQFGVRSAMASSQAKRLCPSLIILRGDMEKYREASRQMHAIFRDYTDIIEPLSLDEAYLDVSACTSCRGSAILIAEEIRARIARAVGITVSAGIATNKFLAKVASDWNKPNGQFAVTPDKQSEFVKQIPVARIWGVGKVGQEKLARMGVENCAQLQAIPEQDLVSAFGRFAHQLHRLSFGLDERPVQTSRVRKSVSVEHTYDQDLPTLALCLEQLPQLMQQLKKRMEGKPYGERLKSYYLKLKFNDFQQTTVETPYLPDNEVEKFGVLLTQAWDRKKRPVRLIGVGYRLRSDSPKQLSLF